MGYSISVEAADPAVNPQSGSLGLTGRVLGPPPTQPATIVVPQNGTRTTSSPITVSGTCPDGTFVSLSRNGVYGGTAECQDKAYSMLADLFFGQNILVLSVYDALGQYGPNSTPVTIFFAPPVLDLPGNPSAGRQMFLQMNATVVAGNPNENISRTVTIVGGVGPYAINWDWGDDDSTLMSKDSDGAVTATHKYDRPGTYKVVVRVTDSLGNSAYIEFVTVVNGPVESFGTTKGNGSSSVPGTLLAVWPLLLLALLMTIFFWLGERRELKKLKRKHLLVGY
jgi:hypothetical protein